MLAARRRVMAGCVANITSRINAIVAAKKWELQQELEVRGLRAEQGLAACL